MTFLPEKELQALTVWFADLRQAARVSSSADRGAVLRRVEKVFADNDSYESEKQLVAKALGYKRWGDLLTWAQSQLGPVVEVVLPEVFNAPPNGWVLREGGLDYSKAQKRLVQTLLRVKEVWAYVDEGLEEGLEKEWADKIRAELTDAFVKSTDPAEFDRECLAFVRGVEEADPTTTWVEVAGVAASALERDTDLPVFVVEVLLSFAKETGVELRKAELDWVKEQVKPASYWFDLLLTAYLYKTKRPEPEQVLGVKELFREATSLLGCFEEVSVNDPDWPNRTKRVYDTNLTLAQVEKAVEQLVELKQSDPSVTRDDLAEAVKEAVAAV